MPSCFERFNKVKPLTIGAHTYTPTSTTTSVTLPTNLEYMTTNPHTLASFMSANFNSCPLWGAYSLSRSLELACAGGWQG